jgi:hypothetical protein
MRDWRVCLDEYLADALCRLPRSVLSYRFEPVAACDMCGADPGQFRNMGLRLKPEPGPSIREPRRASPCRSRNAAIASWCLPIHGPSQPASTNHYGAAEDYWAEDYFTEEPGYFGAEIATAQGLLGFRQGMRALDIGAGIGKAMKAMMAAGFDTKGI